MASAKDLFLLAGTLSVLLVSLQCAPLSHESFGEYDTLVKPAHLLEGDIAGLLPNGKKFASLAEQHRAMVDSHGRNGIIDGEYWGALRWEGGVMPYSISPLFTNTERAQILAAVAEINDKAVHLKLIPRTTEINFVNIKRGGPNTGCYSYVGNFGLANEGNGEGQELNLQVARFPWEGHCMFHGIIVHELVHAVGFLHEQSRTDRDDYVEINWDNIPEGYHSQFENYDSETVTAFGQPYDINSLMHYEKYDFAIDRNTWTIRPKSPNQHLPTGQRVGLTDIDTAKINAMYPK